MPTAEVAGRLEFFPLQQSHGKGRILHDLFAREVSRRLDVDDGTRFAVGILAHASDAETYNVGDMCDWFFLPRTEGIGRISSGAPANSHPFERQYGEQGYS